MANILITGAAGNLGSLLARYILENEKDLSLILMQHRKKVPGDISGNLRAQVRNADLSVTKTLHECLDGADVIVHFAGVLFKAGPEKFLPETNTRYFKNLVDVARTRLEEEQFLFKNIENPVSLRVGMVYGKGILMIDAAEWFARRRLLGVWQTSTDIHLISKTDFCRAVVAAVKNESAKGIFHVGDEGHDTLQSFLDYACETWGCKKPWRMPLWLIYCAAYGFESVSKVFGTLSPLTKDFIDIGRVSYYGDTFRFRKELLAELKFRNVNEGVNELVDREPQF